MTMHGQFVIETAEKVVKDKNSQWFSESDLKIGTEASLFAAHKQVIRTNYVKHHISRTSESFMCRLCGKNCEIVQHLVSG